MHIPTRRAGRAPARGGSPRAAFLVAIALGMLALLGTLALGTALAPPPETIVVAPFRW